MLAQVISRFMQLVIYFKTFSLIQKAITTTISAKKGTKKMKTLLQLKIELKQPFRSHLKIK